ncbi:Phosphoglycerate mutase family protein [Trifolium repens]|nr:Phosphoglycerate mutase family protein [Trifolium repens]
MMKLDQPIVFNFTIASLDQPFQFHVFSISGAFNFTIASLDQPLVFNFHPSISGVFNFTIASLDQPFQFHVFQISILQFDLTIGFVLLCRTNISSGEVLKQKAFKHADSDASNVEVRHAQGVDNVEGEKNHDAYLSDDLFDANLTPLGWKQFVRALVMWREDWAKERY